jgi:hypothetical protein
MQEDGVIKFDLCHTPTEPVASLFPGALNTWRNRLWQRRLIGRQAGIYGGLGYGNVSRRVEPPAAPSGQRGFIISGTQTGDLARLDVRHYCMVTGWNVQRNRIIARGPIRPSSEALTHAALYDQDGDIRVVFHVHSPAIWQAADRLRLIRSDPAVAYGTPQMACEVAHLFLETDARQAGIFIMGGHADGVIAFGTDEQTTGTILLNTLERSLQH